MLIERVTGPHVEGRALCQAIEWGQEKRKAASEEGTSGSKKLKKVIGFPAWLRLRCETVKQSLRWFLRGCMPNPMTSCIEI